MIRFLFFLHTIFSLFFSFSLDDPRYSTAVDQPVRPLPVGENVSSTVSSNAKQCSTVAAAFLIPRFYTTLSRFFNRERILRERFQRPASRMHHRRSNSSREPFFRVASRARSSPLQASSYDSILVIDISRHIPLRQLSFTRFIDEDLSRPLIRRLVSRYFLITQGYS